MYYLQTKDYVEFPSDMLRHTSSFLQRYKLYVHICVPCQSAMTSRRKRSSAPVDFPAAIKNRMKELEPTPNICTYWPNNPAFDPKRVLLRCVYFINKDRTEYVSVGF